MLDLHLHGAFGVDLLTADEEQLDLLALGLASAGVEEFLPTLVPVPLGDLAPLSARLSAWIRSRRPGDGRGAQPRGIHFEGPFVSPARCGALHRESLLPAVARNLDAFLHAVGEVPGRPMMTIAPEVAGGIEAIRRLSQRGWLLSIGHTEAEPATLDEALAAGARHMTHLANAMRELHHREPGPVGWGLVNDAVTVDVVGDLAHLSAAMLRLVYRAKGADRVALISDAAPPAGLHDGTYEVWGERLTVDGGCVRNRAGALAGSACLLPEALRRLEEAGFPAEELRRSAEDVPRRILTS